jgi:hypothetical protein
MPSQQELIELKQQIKDAVNRNSNRGFVNYSGCMRVCGEMQGVMQAAEQYAQSGNYQLAFDIYLMVLIEVFRLVSHADDSAGGCSDVTSGCLSEINKLCRNAYTADEKYFFDTLVKTAKNKVFNGWEEYAYRLLKSAATFVRDSKQAQKVYELFPSLGKMYDEKEYPDKLLITLEIIERLEGKAAADRYLMDNIHVPELREIAVKSAISRKDYNMAEKLCIEALEKKGGRHTRWSGPWAYYLEQVYAETGKASELLAIVRDILFSGDTGYFHKLKALYIQQGRWEQEEDLLWQDLPGKIGIQGYVELLSKEGELDRLLEVVSKHKSYVESYGKQLAAAYPNEVYQLFEDFILAEAQEATVRGKYKRVCYIIKDLVKAGGRERALDLIDRLHEMYQRRPAMLEELAGLKKKLL